ncbi:sugar-binding protein [uncultured Paraglaciecola sp.]|uniref:sugar-binding protein n=1 Tax=uncultured Paraglaciecola sp. TaxID=1765024 RepID=UPI002596DEE3|nr:sugar-binding protein [uncultured Paraglaciecola sp.]
MSKYILLASLISTPIVANEIAFTPTTIKIDGIAESTWDQADWHDIPYLIQGEQPSAADFSGRYKVLWDNQFLYVQAEIVDDILIDKIADPLERYWDDDALEIFIDSDASGGNHQFNHTAMAYHIALDNQAIDIAEDKSPRDFNDHLISQWKRSSTEPNHIIWEVAIRLYSNDFTDAKPLPPMPLKAGQKLGFMLAYCDNDGSDIREHFVGSHDIKPVNGDKNRGWIDAGVFGQYTLKNQ